MVAHLDAHYCHPRVILLLLAVTPWLAKPEEIGLTPISIFFLLLLPDDRFAPVADSVPATATSG